MASGNDTLIGGPGTDVAAFDGPRRSRYVVTQAQDGTHVKDILGHAGGGRPPGCQVLKFDDKTVPATNPGPDNRAPVAKSLSIKVVKGGKTAPFAAIADPDGDNLVVKVVVEGSGSVQVANGFLVYTHNGDATKSATLKVTATDLYGVTKSAEFQVNIVAAPQNGGSGDDVLAGGSGNDRISGGAGNDVVSGGAGNDKLDGGTGDDRVAGGSGNDVLIGGSGADTLDGGPGTDTASYASSTAAGVRINLAKGTASGGHAAGDKLVSIENLVGSPKADVLTGNSLANRIQGGAVADTLTGGGGRDTFVYTSLADSKGTAKDVIKGFKVKGSSRDLIDLSAIDANTKKAGNNAFT